MTVKISRADLVVYLWCKFVDPFCRSDRLINWHQNWLEFSLLSARDREREFTRVYTTYTHTLTDTQSEVKVVSVTVRICLDWLEDLELCHSRHVTTCKVTTAHTKPLRLGAELIWVATTDTTDFFYMWLCPAEFLHSRVAWLDPGMFPASLEHPSVTWKANLLVRQNSEQRIGSDFFSFTAHQ